jgi:hypothetical protein
MNRLIVAAALLLAAAPLAAEEGVFEKTIPFPRERLATLDFKAHDCIIRTVEVRNYPDEDDIHKARNEDPKDTSWLWWEFFIDNRSAGNRAIKLFVEILDKNGQVVKSGDRSSTVDAHETDSVRLSTRMRTLDIVDSPKVRIRAEIRPK